MTNIGYARVSTEGQDVALQVEALKEAGCAPENIFTDRASGKTSSRPGLDRCLAVLGAGDTLVVWKLDRLGRSLQHLAATVSGLGERGVGFRSLTEGFDTTTNGGRLIFHVFAAIAEFERGLIIERTEAGLATARKQGRVGGRPRALNGEQRTLVRRLASEGSSVATIARMLGTSRPTIYRALAA
jgi:DNA invertase Pin-like site-specific DNA recombinase